MSDNEFTSWLKDLPKAELHLHIDGSLQAERLLSLAKKNKVNLPYKNIKEIESAYDFINLQSFLDLYYLGASVLRDEEDFYHLMMDYLIMCRRQNIRHTEIMIEPQTYLPYNVSFSTIMSGFDKAIQEAGHLWGQSVYLILSFLRHLSEEEAIQTLDLAEPYREHFIAIGLASSEQGNPPEKFKNLYEQAKQRGYFAVAHAGEEGTSEYIWNSLTQLRVNRIDHGVRCVDDTRLVEYLREDAIPLTVCPLSNIKLCVFDTMANHNILQMLDLGLNVTVNSDDPAYFGGFLNENFLALYHDLGLKREQAVVLAKNSFQSSFLPHEQKKHFISQVDKHAVKA